jgi:hypothetical protein
VRLYPTTPSQPHNRATLIIPERPEEFQGNHPSNRAGKEELHSSMRGLPRGWGEVQSSACYGPGKSRRS